MRNPFVDILSFIQIDLLKRDKEGRLIDKSLITATILGIAHAMRNTG
jgi:phosphoenolpyruvate carboxylase